MITRTLQLRFLITVATLLTLMFLLGQTMAVINYDFTVSLGLQESQDAVTEIGVAANKGFGVGDTVVYIPLFVLGIAGMIKRRYWGFFCMCGALAITVYWPVVCLTLLYYAKGAPGFTFSAYAEYTVLLSAITAYGIWGLVFIYRNRTALTDG